MRFRIERLDRVAFSAPVREHHVEVRLAPWDDASQHLLSLDIASDPVTRLASHRDGFGNQVHRTALLSPHQTLSVRVRAEVETLLDDDPPAPGAVPPAREAAWLADALRQAPRLWDLVLARGELTPDLATTRGTPARRDGLALFEDVQGALAWIAGTFDYQPGAAPAAALGVLLTTGAGSAADLAHLLLSIVRGWGVPARFVTGYLDDPAPAAAVPLHHWAEVLIPGAGWRGCDPSRGRLADGRYIRLAIGRDRRDVVPWRQSYKGDGGLATEASEVSVTRLD